jgi:putative ABC transport system permease protein
MLDAANDRGEQAHARILTALLLAGNAGESDDGVELVDGAIGFDAQRILGDALAARETGFACVTETRVNTIEGDARIVEWFVGHHINFIYIAILYTFGSYILCRTRPFMGDIRFGFRAFFRDPAFTAAATVVLALGMGATTAVFTLVHAVLLEPLAYPDSARLVYVWTTRTDSGAGTEILSAEDYWEFRAKDQFFERTAGYVRNSWTVTGIGEPQRLTGMNVTADFFDTLGVHPVIGHAFAADEFHLGRDLKVIFSHQFWREHMNGETGVVGRHVTLDGAAYEIAGIMPADFPLASGFDIWTPLAVESPLAQGRRSPTMRVFGRLKPRVSVQRAQSEATSLAADFAVRYPEDRHHSFQLTTFLDFEVGSARESLWILAAAVACLMLIACSNVASLLLARGAARVREMAVRAAVGASRAALVRQIMVESTLLAIVGGALGVALAAGSVRAVLVLVGAALPRSREIHADARVLAFAFVLALATGILCGIVPAWRGSRVDLAEALKEGGRHGSGRRGNRFRATLVVAEVAFGVALLAAAGLLARSLRALGEVHPGYDTRRAIAMQLALPASRYQDPEQTRLFFERVLRGVENLPGVEAAGSTNLLPLMPDTNRVGVWTDSQPIQSADTKIVLDNRVVTPGYFRAMGVPLIAGRFFDWTDRPETPKVVIINDAFAREAFPRGDALGRRITLDLGAPWTAQVVGIVRGFRESSLGEEPRRELFTVETQTTIRGQTLVVRTSRDAGDPQRIVAAVRGVLASVDPDVPVHNVRTMQQQVEKQLAQPRLRGILLVVFSCVALALASMGVYGVIACGVAERKQEIGIRMALGARQRQVRLMIAGEGLKLAAIGLVIGLAGAAAASRLLRGLLFGISPFDPASFIVAAAVFVAVAAAASYLPAHRATRIDPLRVLTSE